jgi:hypothetical protein
MNPEGILAKIKSMIPTYKVILFYALIMIVVSTVGSIQFGEEGRVHGVAVGAVVSLALWYKYGQNY